MTSNQGTYEPLVSIALTTFNGKNLLKEQLDSILKQTYQNYEVVISDDGSDQETIDILNEYAKRDPRISWSRSPLSRGFRPNTQNAISLCKGEIIVLCDQDDVWFENKLAEHVKAYEDPSVGWAYNRFVITDAENNPIGYIEDKMPDYFRHKTLLENAWGSCIGAAQSSYRAALAKKAMPIPSYVPAHDSWIQLAIYPAKPAFIPKVLNTYRQHNSQQVGMVDATDPEALRAREAKAISDNFDYLWKLSFNRQLTFTKRAYLFSAYMAKRIRSILRKLVGKNDSRLIADASGQLVMKRK